MDSPSPPLLHEVKLSGPVAGGSQVCRLRQEGKLALLHEVKLYRLAAGGMLVVRLRQEGKLALLHEVKLYRLAAGGMLVVRLRQEGNLALLHEVKLLGHQHDFISSRYGKVRGPLRQDCTKCPLCLCCFKQVQNQPMAKVCPRSRLKATALSCFILVRKLCPPSLETRKPLFVLLSRLAGNEMCWVATNRTSTPNWSHQREYQTFLHVWGGQFCWVRRSPLPCVPWVVECLL